MKAHLLHVLVGTALLGSACSTPVGDEELNASAAQLGESTDERHGTVDAGTTWPMPETTGPDDNLARQACGLADARAEHFHLASRPEDAATIILVPSRTKRFHLHRPSSTAVGYAKLQTADWHTLVSFGAPAGVGFSVAGGQLQLATAKNAACSTTTTDTRYVIHEWGTYLVTFPATGPDAFYATILAQN